MDFKNTRSCYCAPLIGLHWLTLLLLAAVYMCMELRGLAPKGSALRANMKTMHFLLGLLALMLVMIVSACVETRAPRLKSCRPSQSGKTSTRDNTLVRMLPDEVR